MVNQQLARSAFILPELVILLPHEVKLTIPFRSLLRSDAEERDDLLGHEVRVLVIERVPGVLHEDRPAGREVHVGGDLLRRAADVGSGEVVLLPAHQHHPGGV